MSGQKFDTLKMTPFAMIEGFSEALKAVACITTFGNTKYIPNSWPAVPNGLARYKEALMRHMLEWAGGEMEDNEHGLHPLIPMVWNALACLELSIRDGLINLEDTEDVAKQAIKKLQEERKERPLSSYEFRDYQADLHGIDEVAG